MKKILFAAAFALAAGYGFSQAEEGDEDVNQDPQEQQDPQENETPEQAAHGKIVSELAQSTPAGPEKGHIISSAAREKALLHANANAAFMENGHAGSQAENAGSNAAEAAGANASETGTTASGIATGLKPAEAGMPETPGKPATLPPVTNTTQGKPDGLPGGGHN